MERKGNGLNVKKFHSLKASPLHVPAQSKKPLSVANFLNNTPPPQLFPTFSDHRKRRKRILNRKLWLPIGAKCVNPMGSQWTIFYIAPVLGNCGSYCSLFGVTWVMPNLVFATLDSWKGSWATLEVGTFGEHLLHASCGAFGMRGIFVPLRERSYPSRILSLFLKMLFKWNFQFYTFSTATLVDFLDDLLISH